MECSWALLLVSCFSWSNLYIDASLSDLDVKQIYEVNHEVRAEYLSPYGGLMLGFAVPFENGQISIEASHTSSLATNNDRGFNQIGLHVRWFPFR